MGVGTIGVTQLLFDFLRWSPRRSSQNHARAVANVSATAAEATLSRTQKQMVQLYSRMHVVPSENYRRVFLHNMTRPDQTCFLFRFGHPPLHFCHPSPAIFAPVFVPPKGFSVDGEIESADEAASYADKCVFVDSGSGSGDVTLEGFVMTDMAITNCG